MVCVDGALIWSDVILALAVSGSPSIATARTPTRCTPKRFTYLKTDIRSLPSLFHMLLPFPFPFLAMAPLMFFVYRPPVADTTNTRHFSGGWKRPCR